MSVFISLLAVEFLHNYLSVTFGTTDEGGFSKLYSYNIRMYKCQEQLIRECPFLLLANYFT